MYDGLYSVWHAINDARRGGAADVGTTARDSGVVLLISGG
jgi:hypothetical protein